MKVVSFALLYLGSVSFFGVDAANLDIASDFRRKWNSWALRRARRDVPLPPGGPLTAAQAAYAYSNGLVRTQDVKGGAGMAQTSQPQGAPPRVKRSNSRQTLSPEVLRWTAGCRFGTCSIHTLGHRLSQLSPDKEKDESAPPEKLGPEGYGRRRRRRRRRSLYARLQQLAAASASSRRL